MMSDELIRVDRLKKAFGKRILFSEVDFSLNNGECLGIVGRNGTGKTTLINIMTKMLKASEGTVTYSFDEKDLPYKIGIQMQDGYFDPMLKVNEIVKLYMNLYSIKKTDVKELLIKHELGKVGGNAISKLSGGERQKLNILLACMHNPDIMFFDEVTTGLDAISRNNILDFLERQKERGKTIIIVSHYFEEIYKLADKVLILKENGEHTINHLKELGNDYSSVKEAILNNIGKEEREEEHI